MPQFGKSYWFPDITLSWHDAITYCYNNGGGYLAEPKTHDERKFLRALLKDDHIHGANNYWMGLRYSLAVYY